MIRKIKLWITVNVFWLYWPHRKGQTLTKFATTEADSAWQLKQALLRSEDPRLRASFFEQILEEYNHAELFSSLYEQHSESKFIPLTPERRALLGTGQPLWKFFAYCAVGEKSALEQFSDLARVLPADDFRGRLRRILRDEAGHVHDANGWIKGSGISVEAAKSEIRRVKLRRMKEAWLRNGQTVTNGIVSILLTFIYYLVAVLGFWTARNKVFGGAPSPRHRTQTATTFTDSGKAFEPIKAGV